jgi:hypothetical protein
LRPWAQVTARVAALLAGALCPVATAAQPVEPPAPRTPPPPPRLEVALRLGGFEMVNSADSYDAVYGETLPLWGVEAAAVLRGRFLVALAYERGEVDGERVLLTRPPRPTGVATELAYAPLHLTLGAVLRPRRPWQLRVGAGPTLLDWRDASGGESQGGSDLGWHVAAGLRRELDRVTLGGELRFSSIPDAVGEGGVTQFFGEDDLGGLALAVVAGYRLR